MDRRPYALHHGCAIPDRPNPAGRAVGACLADPQRPYTLDFLSLGPEMLGRDLERGLIERLRSLILELGKGFAFAGSQYHIEVADPLHSCPGPTPPSPPEPHSGGGGYTAYA